jgi:hypothetical protein
MRSNVCAVWWITQWAGPKVAVGLDDSSVRQKIVGVVLQNPTTLSQVLMNWTVPTGSNKPLRP